MKKPKQVLISIGIFCLFASSNGFAQTETESDDAVFGASLEDFFTAALDNNPRLKIAEEKMNVGSARKRMATGQLLPQLNASANISDNRLRRSDTNLLDEYDGNRYNLQLSQVLFNWNAFSQRKQASLLEDQYEEEYYAEVAFLLTDVAEKYFNVLQAEDALDSITAEVEAVSNQLAQIQSYYDRQLALITDLYRAQASLAAAEAEQLGLQSEVELAREALRAATGISAGPIYRLDEEADIPPVTNSVQYWVQQALANSPVIRAREYAMQAAEEHISETRGSYMPRVNFVISRQNSNIGFENVPIQQSDTTYLGLDVSIPLFAGGSNRARVSEAMSQKAMAEYELRQLELEVGERTRAVFLRAKSSESLTTAAERLAESTALAAEASQQGFELGVVTSVDVLNAIRDRFQAERDLQQARYEHVKLLLILQREAGTLTAEDLLEVGAWLVENPGA